MINYSMAKEEYEKYIKESKGFMGIGFRGGRLESFLDIQKESGAYQGSDIGLRTVSLKDIKGSVQKYRDFNKNFVPRNSVVESRWCNIYMAYMNDAALAPVKLYKIKDNYYVYDGNHRISVAKYLNFASIEAEVKEFLPSEDTKENVIYRERFNFEKQTSLYSIKFTETDQYKRLFKEIEDFQNYLREKENIHISLQESAEMWNESIFTPAITILSENSILKKMESRTYSDLFIHYLDHKYFESVERGRDVGFEFAIVDYINLVKSNQGLDENMVVNEIIKDNLEKLRIIDERKKMDLEINKKWDILNKVTGLEFENRLLLIYEVEEYMHKNDIHNFENGVKSWNTDELNKNRDYFKMLLELLPLKYREFLKKFMTKDKNWELSLLIYKKHKNKYEESSANSIIAHYIIEIFIPLAEKLITNDIDEKEVATIYYNIQNRYFYYKEYDADITVEKAFDIYFESEIKRSYKIQDILLLRFSVNEKKDVLIKHIFEQYRDKIVNYHIFKEVFDKYGFPMNPGTFATLYRNYENYKRVENSSEKDWVRDKFTRDLEKLSSSEEIIAFYKTYDVFKNVNYGVKESNIIDFYADILSYGEYLVKDLNFVDIIDLAIEYKNSFNI